MLVELLNKCSNRQPILVALNPLTHGVIHKMSFSPTSPVTGLAQADLTSPTYTIVAGQALNSRSKQWTVTALGGTQTGVSVNSVSNPFTITAEVPATLKGPGVPNPVTGVLTGTGRNVYVVRVRKGTLPLAGQSPQTSMVEVRMSIVAGADTADSNSLQAMLSLAFGLCSQTSSALGDTVQDGVI